MIKKTLPKFGNGKGTKKTFPHFGNGNQRLLFVGIAGNGNGNGKKKYDVIKKTRPSVMEVSP